MRNTSYLIPHSPYLKPVPVLAAIALLSGCASDECLDNQNSLPLAGFYGTPATPGAEPPGISLDGLIIEGVGVPGDSLLSDGRSSLAESYLPFKLDGGSTSFRFSYLLGDTVPQASDVVTFSYEAEPFFASAACGAIYRYKISDITWTTNYIDSVTCPAGIIDNTPGQNIRIYFRTAQEEPQP